jgi:hypothetical protein
MMPLRVHDFSPFVDENGEVNIVNRIQGTIKYGSNWYGEMQAQKQIITRLEKLLPDQYSLIRNFLLPETDIHVPIILVGPPGVWVIVASDQTGVFEARGKEWLRIDTRRDEFVPVQPNPVMRATLLSRAVQDFLAENKYSISDLEPIVLFANPGANVGANESDVRIVLIDAFGRFIRAIQVGNKIFNSSQVREIVDLFERTHESSLLTEQKEEKKSISFLDSISLPKFSTSQWITLGIIGTLNVIVWLVIIALLLSNI